MPRLYLRNIACIPGAAALCFVAAPLLLQDHGHPVWFRNVWIRPLGQYDQPEG